MGCELNGLVIFYLSLFVCCLFDLSLFFSVYNTFNRYPLPYLSFSQKKKR